jgi:hypothetical protein
MPTQFTEQQKADIKNQVVDWISEGQTLRELCRQEGMPSWKTVYQWQNEDEDFKSRFARARLIGFDVIAEEALHIADTPQEGVKYMNGPLGSTETREDMLGHRKLQIETRLKLLAKWDPKRYGERVDHTSSDGSMATKPTIIELTGPTQASE